uniref:Uncharacterized protein n=1 Tax=Tanacetum cinerariifolium TaxID=118510 RepID=A0A699KCW9_TANCI|nr:hypothetical protein [Tanacetum cinerariifolium]
MKIEEELGADKSTELGSNDTEEMVNVLSSIEAANILTSGGAAASVSPGDVLLTVGVPTVSGARLRAEEELKMMIEGLDRSNEVIAKHLREYEQARADLSVGEKLELISELVKYQDHRAKILKMKTSENVSEEELKGMIQLVPLEEVYVEALQVKHPIIDWEIHSEGKREEDLHQLWTLVKETLSIKQDTKDKENELWVELKRLFEPDFEDQLWTHNQAFMHDPLD